MQYTHIHLTYIHITQTCTYTFTRTHTYTYICTNMQYTCTYTSHIHITHTHMHTHSHVHIRTHINIHAVDVHIHTCPHTFTCTHACTTYMHTYINTHTPPHIHIIDRHVHTFAHTRPSPFPTVSCYRSEQTSANPIPSIAEPRPLWFDPCSSAQWMFPLQPGRGRQNLFTSPHMTLSPHPFSPFLLTKNFTPECCAHSSSHHLPCCGERRTMHAQSGFTASSPPGLGSSSPG